MSYLINSYSHLRSISAFEFVVFHWQYIYISLGHWFLCCCILCCLCYTGKDGWNLCKVWIYLSWNGGFINTWSKRQIQYRRWVVIRIFVWNCTTLIQSLLNQKLATCHIMETWVMAGIDFLAIWAVQSVRKQFWNFHWACLYSTCCPISFALNYFLFFKRKLHTLMVISMTSKTYINYIRLEEDHQLEYANIHVYISLEKFYFSQYFRNDCIGELWWT